MKTIRQRIVRGFAVFYVGFLAPSAQGYTFDMVVPDVRQPASLSGGSACPVPAHQLTAPGSINLQWSTALNTNPVTIVTQDQTTAGRLSEIAAVVQQSIAVWTGVTGTTLLPATFSTPARTAIQNACTADGTNSVCFDQADLAFTPGVLAFTRVVTADRAGIQLGNGPVSTQPGEILDADIYFNPDSSGVIFATPQALAATPKAYDLESLLIHELGHFLGFSHSAVWRAICFPSLLRQDLSLERALRRSSSMLRSVTTIGPVCVCYTPIPATRRTAAPLAGAFSQPIHSRFPPIPQA
jgi:matrixin